MLSNKVQTEASKCALTPPPECFLEIKGKTSEKQPHVLMLSRLHYKSQQQQKQNVEEKKESSRLFSAPTPLPPNICFGRQREGEGGAAGRLATRREKLPIKRCRSQRPHQKHSRVKKAIHEAFPSHILATWLLAARSEGANHHPRTRRTGRGWRGCRVGGRGEVKHLKCLHSITEKPSLSKV